MVSKEDIVMLVQRALVLLGSASNTITLERRKIAWSRFNPKLKSLANEEYEKRKTSLFGPGFLEKASKRIEASKTLDKVSYNPSHPLPKKRARFDNDKDDLRHFLSRGRSDAVRQSEEPAPAAVHLLHQVPAKPTVSSTRQASTPGPDTLHQKQVRPVSPHLLVSFLNSKQTVVCFNVRFINIAALDKYPIAGRVQVCSQNWARITTDPWILDTVQGYQLELESIPVQRSPPPGLHLSPQECNLIQNEIEKLIQKGAVSQVDPMQGQFISQIFVVPKKEGSNQW